MKTLTKYQQSVIDRMKDGYVLEAKAYFPRGLGVYHLHRPDMNEWIAVSITSVLCLRDAGAITTEYKTFKSEHGTEYQKSVASLVKV